MSGNFEDVSSLTEGAGWVVYYCGESDANGAMTTTNCGSEGSGYE